MVIEFINVRTGGIWSKKLQKSPWIQILFAIVMSVIPGCLGTYTVVSLYVHRVVNFPALMAALISTTGDESFFMFSLFPEKALYINLIIIGISIAVAVTLQLTMKNKFIGLQNKEMSFPIHENESCSHDHHHHHADEVFISWGVETAKKFKECELKEILESLLEEKTYGVILRAKGIVEDVEGGWLHFDYVPGESSLRVGCADVTGKLCVIGSDLDQFGIAKLFGV